MIDRSFFLLKPDAVSRRLIGPLLARVEAAGLAIVNLAMVRPRATLLAAHYAEHAGKDFFAPMLEFMRSAPCVAGVVLPATPLLAGEEVTAVARLRRAIGPFDPRTPGTIRGDFVLEGRPTWENLIHAADSIDSARREANIWFGFQGWTPV
jgi:nucleoside-diphosphate kinase